MPESPNAMRDLKNSVKNVNPDRKGSFLPPVPTSTGMSERKSQIINKPNKPVTNKDIDREVNRSMRWLKDVQSPLIVREDVNISDYINRKREGLFTSAKKTIKGIVDKTPLGDWFADINFERQVKKLEKTGMSRENAVQKIYKEIDKELDNKYGDDQVDEYPVDEGTAKSYGVTPKRASEPTKLEKPQPISVSTKDIKQIMDAGFPFDEAGQNELFRSRFSQMIANDRDAQAKIVEISELDLISKEEAENRYIRQSLSNIAKLPKSALYQKIFNQNITRADAEFILAKELKSRESNKSVTVDVVESVASAGETKTKDNLTDLQRKNKALSDRLLEFEVQSDMALRARLARDKAEDKKVAPKSAARELSASEKLKEMNNKMYMSKEKLINVSSPKESEALVYQLNSLKDSAYDSFEAAIEYQDLSNKVLAKLNMVINQQVKTKEDTKARIDFVTKIVPMYGKDAGMISNLATRRSTEKVVFEDKNSFEVAKNTLHLLLNERNSADFATKVSQYLITFLRPHKTSINDHDEHVNVNGLDLIFPTEFADKKYHQLAEDLINAIESPV
jgi:hypothetical protein